MVTKLLGLGYEMVWFWVRSGMSFGYEMVHPYCSICAAFRAGVKYVLVLVLVLKYKYFCVLVLVLVLGF